MKIQMGILAGVVFLLGIPTPNAHADQISHAFNAAWRSGVSQPVLIEKNGVFTWRGTTTKISISPIPADSAGLAWSFDQFTDFKPPKQSIRRNPTMYDLQPTFSYRVEWPKGSTWPYAYGNAVMDKEHQTYWDLNDTGLSFQGQSAQTSTGYVASGTAILQFVEYWFQFSTGAPRGALKIVMRGEIPFHVQAQGTPYARRTVSVGVAAVGRGDDTRGPSFTTGVIAYARIAESGGIVGTVTGFLQRRVAGTWKNVLIHPVFVPRHTLVGVVPFAVFFPGTYRIAFVDAAGLIGIADFSVIGKPAGSTAAVFRTA